jgi:hypothetical protein
MVGPSPIIHAAIHDAVNGVERRFKPYTADLSSPGASPCASVDAAVATAARDVLVALAPNQKARIEADYVAALAAIPDGDAETCGEVLTRHLGDRHSFEASDRSPPPGARMRQESAPYWDLRWPLFTRSLPTT